MARIIGGIGTSHTPTIGFALDAGKQDDPAWAPIFAAYAPLKQWLADTRPDVVFTIYNDHVTSFFFDHYSAFTLGVGATFDAADEGGGARALPTIAGHPDLARHIGEGWSPTSSTCRSSSAGVSTMAVYPHSASCSIGSTAGPSR